MFEARIAENEKRGGQGSSCIFSSKISSTKGGSVGSTPTMATSASAASPRNTHETVSARPLPLRPSSCRIPKSVTLQDTRTDADFSLSNRSLKVSSAWSNAETANSYEQSCSTFHDDDMTSVHEHEGDGEEEEEEEEKPRLLVNSTVQDNFEYYRIERGDSKRSLVSTGSTRTLQELLKKMEDLAAKAPLDEKAPLNEVSITVDRRGYRMKFGTAKKTSTSTRSLMSSNHSLMSNTPPVPEDTPSSDEPYNARRLLMDDDHHENFGCYNIKPRKGMVKTGSTRSLKDRMKAFSKE